MIKWNKKNDNDVTSSFFVSVNMLMVIWGRFALGLEISAFLWHSRGRQFNSVQLHQNVRGLTMKIVSLFCRPLDCAIPAPNPGETLRAAQIDQEVFSPSHTPGIQLSPPTSCRMPASRPASLLEAVITRADFVVRQGRWACFEGVYFFGTWPKKTSKIWRRHTAKDTRDDSL